MNLSAGSGDERKETEQGEANRDWEIEMLAFQLIGAGFLTLFLAALVGGTSEPVQD